MTSESIWAESGHSVLFRLVLEGSCEDEAVSHFL